MIMLCQDFDLLSRRHKEIWKNVAADNPTILIRRQIKIYASTSCSDITERRESELVSYLGSFVGKLIETSK